MGREDPPGLPPWLLQHGDNPVLQSILADLFQNPEFRAYMEQTFAPEDNLPFLARVGDRSLLDQINTGRSRRDQVKMGKNAGGVALYNNTPADPTMNTAAIALDIDKIHDATRPGRGMPVDSAQARGLVRDALVHEFAHLVPVAQSRHARSITGDPKPNDPNAAQHPVIQKENKLRGLLGLDPKNFYGLLR